MSRLSVKKGFVKLSQRSRAIPDASEAIPDAAPAIPEPDEGSPPATPTALIFQSAALVLSYPEAELLDRLELIEDALAGTSAAERFAPVLAHLRGTSLRELQSFHVQEFDLSRKHALHLSYWTDGDTRRRGEVLTEVKGVYRDSGLLVDLAGELPDHLPIVLEFAVADPERGLALLQRFRASVELIRLGLAADRLPHASVMQAVCDCLPGPSPKNRAEVQAMFGEVQPVEFVGLDTLDRHPRLDDRHPELDDRHPGLNDRHPGPDGRHPGPDDRHPGLDPGSLPVNVRS